VTRIFRRAAALCAAASLLIPAACGRKPAPAARRYSQPDGLFSFVIPAGWREIRITGNPEPRIELIDVSDSDGLRESASVVFYPKGNPNFPTPKDYLKLHSGPGPQTPRPIAAAGLRGLEFLSQAPTVSSPERGTGQPLENKTVVLPAANGFFALACSAPAGSAACAGTGGFQEILDSFKPGPSSQDRAARREEKEPRH
jgi:hypothetical protein